MKEDLFKIIGIFIICLFIFYLAMKALKLQISVMEGFLTSAEPSSPPNSPNPSAIANATSGPAVASGIGKGASQYSSQIRAMVDKLKATVAVKQHKKEYEMTILNLDEFINYCMLNVASSLNPNAPIDDERNMKLFNNLNTLSKSKESLNDIMKFIDSN